MKNILFFLLLSATVSAQITVSSSTFPAPGDTLRTATVIAPTGIDITAPGGDQSWDFSNLNVQNDPFLSIYGGTDNTGADTIAPSANVTSSDVTGAGISFYSSTDNAFSLVAIAGDGSTLDSAFAGITFATSFQPPYIERHGDLNFFDQFTSTANSIGAIAGSDLPPAILDLLPVAPDSIRIRVEINRTDLVDGWGTLTIPGDSYEVLRERRDEIRETKVEALVPFLGWLDVTSALPDFLQEFVAPDTTRSYYFWNDMEKEYIAFVRMDGNSDTEVERIQFKWNQNAVTVREPEVALENVTIFPNPTADVIRAEVTLAEAVATEFQLFDAAGKLLLRERQATSPFPTVQFDLSAFGAGTYYLRLVDGSGAAYFSRAVVRQ